MTTVYLSQMKSRNEIRRGQMTLIGSTGIHYQNAALNIPGYGWVPCSKKLQSNMTTNPDELMLVISDDDESYKPVTSDIWVTRCNFQTVALF